MKPLTTIILIMLTAFFVSACAEDPHSVFNSPDQQRAHADKAQSNLSSETNK